MHTAGRLPLAAGKSTDYDNVFWVYPQCIYFRHLGADPRLQFRPLGYNSTFLAAPKPSLLRPAFWVFSKAQDLTGGKNKVSLFRLTNEFRSLSDRIAFTEMESWNLMSKIYERTLSVLLTKRVYFAKGGSLNDNPWYHQRGWSLLVVVVVWKEKSGWFHSTTSLAFTACRNRAEIWKHSSAGGKKKNTASFLQNFSWK